MLGAIAAAFTVTLTVPTAVVYRVESVGVKVIDCAAVPTLGTLVGKVKANVPATDTEPPLNTDEESICPYWIVEAVGAEKISGVTLLTVTLNVPLAMFPTLSVAVAVTVVLPTANVPPLTGEYVMVGVPMLSVALAPLNVTLAPLSDVALTLTLPPTLSTGAVVSTTPPPDSAPLLATTGRPRAKRKP